MSSMTVDQIAELAKKELDAAEAGVEHARRQLKEGALLIVDGGWWWCGGGWVNTSNVAQ